MTCAALLHDAVEDHAEDIARHCGTRQSAFTILARHFSERTAELVAAVTNPAYEPSRGKQEQDREHVIGSLDDARRAAGLDHGQARSETDPVTAQVAADVYGPCLTPSARRSSRRSSPRRACCGLVTATSRTRTLSCSPPTATPTAWSRRSPNAAT